MKNKSKKKKLKFPMSLRKIILLHKNMCIQISVGKSHILD